MALTINLENHFNYTLLEIDGTVNALSAPLLHSAIRTATREGNRHLIIDCTLLKSLNSDGLKVLLSSQLELAGRYILSLCNVSRPIAALMELSGLTRYIEINYDIHEAESGLLENDYAMGRINIRPS